MNFNDLDVGGRGQFQPDGFKPGGEAPPQKEDEGKEKKSLPTIKPTESEIVEAAKLAGIEGHTVAKFNVIRTITAFLPFLLISKYFRKFWDDNVTLKGNVYFEKDVEAAVYRQIIAREHFTSPLGEIKKQILDKLVIATEDESIKREAAQLAKANEVVQRAEKDLMAFEERARESGLNPDQKAQYEQLKSNYNQFLDHQEKVEYKEVLKRRVNDYSEQMVVDPKSDIYKKFMKWIREHPEDAALTSSEEVQRLAAQQEQSLEIAKVMKERIKEDLTTEMMFQQIWLQMQIENVKEAAVNTFKDPEGLKLFLMGETKRIKGEQEAAEDEYPKLMHDYEINMRKYEIELKNAQEKKAQGKVFIEPEEPKMPVKPPRMEFVEKHMPMMTQVLFVELKPGDAQRLTLDKAFQRLAGYYQRIQYLNDQLAIDVPNKRKEIEKAEASALILERAITDKLLLIKQTEPTSGTPEEIRERKIFASAVLKWKAIYQGREMVISEEGGKIVYSERKKDITKLPEFQKMMEKRKRRVLVDEAIVGALGVTGYLIHDRVTRIFHQATENTSLGKFFEIASGEAEVKEELEADTKEKTIDLSIFRQMRQQLYKPQAEIKAEFERSQEKLTIPQKQPVTATSTPPSKPVSAEEAEKKVEVEHVPSSTDEISPSISPAITVETAVTATTQVHRKTNEFSFVEKQVITFLKKIENWADRVMQYRQNIGLLEQEEIEETRAFRTECEDLIVQLYKVSPTSEEKERCDQLKKLMYRLQEDLGKTRRTPFHKIAGNYCMNRLLAEAYVHARLDPADIHWGDAAPVWYHAATGVYAAKKPKPDMHLSIFEKRKAQEKIDAEWKKLDAYKKEDRQILERLMLDVLEQGGFNDLTLTKRFARAVDDRIRETPSTMTQEDFSAMQKKMKKEGSLDRVIAEANEAPKLKAAQFKEEHKYLPIQTKQDTAWLDAVKAAALFVLPFNFGPLGDAQERVITQEDVDEACRQLDHLIRPPYDDRAAKFPKVAKALLDAQAAIRAQFIHIELDTRNRAFKQELSAREFALACLEAGETQKKVWKREMVPGSGIYSYRCSHTEPGKGWTVIDKLEIVSHLPELMQYLTPERLEKMDPTTSAVKKFIDRLSEDAEMMDSETLREALLELDEPTLTHVLSVVAVAVCGLAQHKMKGDPSTVGEEQALQQIIHNLLPFLERNIPEVRYLRSKDQVYLRDFFITDRLEPAFLHSDEAVKIRQLGNIEFIRSLSGYIPSDQDKKNGVLFVYLVGIDRILKDKPEFQIYHQFLMRRRAELEEVMFGDHLSEIPIDLQELQEGLAIERPAQQLLPEAEIRETEIKRGSESVSELEVSKPVLRTPAQALAALLAVPNMPENEAFWNLGSKDFADGKQFFANKGFFRDRSYDPVKIDKVINIFRTAAVAFKEILEDYRKPSQFNLPDVQFNLLKAELHNLFDRWVKMAGRVQNDITIAEGFRDIFGGLSKEFPELGLEDILKDLENKVKIKQEALASALQVRQEASAQTESPQKVSAKPASLVYLLLGPAPSSDLFWQYLGSEDRYGPEALNIFKEEEQIILNLLIHYQEQQQKGEKLEDSVVQFQVHRLIEDWVRIARKDNIPLAVAIGFRNIVIGLNASIPQLQLVDIQSALIEIVNFRLAATEPKAIGPAQPTIEAEEKMEAAEPLSGISLLRAELHGEVPIDKMQYPAKVLADQFFDAALICLDCSTQELELYYGYKIEGFFKDRTAPTDEQIAQFHKLNLSANDLQKALDYIRNQRPDAAIEIHERLKKLANVRSAIGYDNRDEELETRNAKWVDLFPAFAQLQRDLTGKGVEPQPAVLDYGTPLAPPLEGMSLGQVNDYLKAGRNAVKILTRIDRRNAPEIARLEGERQEILKKNLMIKNDLEQFKDRPEEDHLRQLRLIHRRGQNRINEINHKLHELANPKELKDLDLVVFYLSSQSKFPLTQQQQSKLESLALTCLEYHLSHAFISGDRFIAIGYAMSLASAGSMKFADDVVRLLDKYNPQAITPESIAISDATEALKRQNIAIRERARELESAATLQHHLKDVEDILFDANADVLQYNMLRPEEKAWIKEKFPEHANAALYAAGDWQALSHHDKLLINQQLQNLIAMHPVVFLSENEKKEMNILYLSLEKKQGEIAEHLKAYAEYEKMINSAFIAAQPDLEEWVNGIDPEKRADVKTILENVASDIKSRIPTGFKDDAGVKAYFDGDDFKALDKLMNFKDLSVDKSLEEQYRLLLLLGIGKGYVTPHVSRAEWYFNILNRSLDEPSTALNNERISQFFDKLKGDREVIKELVRIKDAHQFVEVSGRRTIFNQMFDRLMGIHIPPRPLELIANARNGESLPLFVNPAVVDYYWMFCQHVMPEVFGQLPPLVSPPRTWTERARGRDLGAPAAQERAAIKSALDQWTKDQQISTSKKEAVIEALLGSLKDSPEALRQIGKHLHARILDLRKEAEVHIRNEDSHALAKYSYNLKMIRKLDIEYKILTPEARQDLRQDLRSREELEEELISVSAKIVTDPAYVFWKDARKKFKESDGEAPAIGEYIEAVKRYQKEIDKPIKSRAEFEAESKRGLEVKDEDVNKASKPILDAILKDLQINAILKAPQKQLIKGQELTQRMQLEVLYVPLLKVEIPTLADLNESILSTRAELIEAQSAWHSKQEKGEGVSIKELENIDKLLEQLNTLYASYSTELQMIVKENKYPSNVVEYAIRASTQINERIRPALQQELQNINQLIGAQKEPEQKREAELGVSVTTYESNVPPEDIVWRRARPFEAETKEAEDTKEAAAFTTTAEQITTKPHVEKQPPSPRQALNLIEKLRGGELLPKNSNSAVIDQYWMFCQYLMPKVFGELAPETPSRLDRLRSLGKTRADVILALEKWKSEVGDKLGIGEYEEEKVIEILMASLIHNPELVELFGNKLNEAVLKLIDPHYQQELREQHPKELELYLLNLKFINSLNKELEFLTPEARLGVMSRKGLEDEIIAEREHTPKNTDAYQAWKAAKKHYDRLSELQILKAIEQYRNAVAEYNRQDPQPKLLALLQVLDNKYAYVKYASSPPVSTPAEAEAESKYASAEPTEMPFSKVAEIVRAQREEEAKRGVEPLPAAPQKEEVRVEISDISIPPELQAVKDTIIAARKARKVPESYLIDFNRLVDSNGKKIVIKGIEKRQVPTLFQRLIAYKEALAKPLPPQERRKLLAQYKEDCVAYNRSLIKLVQDQKDHSPAKEAVHNQIQEVGGVINEIEKELKAYEILKTPSEQRAEYEDQLINEYSTSTEGASDFFIKIKTNIEQLKAPHLQPDERKKLLQEYKTNCETYKKALNLLSTTRGVKPLVGKQRANILGYLNKIIDSVNQELKILEGSKGITAQVTETETKSKKDYKAERKGYIDQAASKIKSLTPEQQSIYAEYEARAFEIMENYGFAEMEKGNEANTKMDECRKQFDQLRQELEEGLTSQPNIYGPVIVELCTASNLPVGPPENLYIHITGWYVASATRGVDYTAILAWRKLEAKAAKAVAVQAEPMQPPTQSFTVTTGLKQQPRQPITSSITEPETKERAEQPKTLKELEQAYHDATQERIAEHAKLMPSCTFSAAERETISQLPDSVKNAFLGTKDEPGCDNDVKKELEKPLPQTASRDTLSTLSSFANAAGTPKYSFVEWEQIDGLSEERLPNKAYIIQLLVDKDNQRRALQASVLTEATALKAYLDAKQKAAPPPLTQETVRFINDCVADFLKPYSTGAKQPTPDRRPLMSELLERLQKEKGIKIEPGSEKYQQIEEAALRAYIGVAAKVYALMAPSPESKGFGIDSEWVAEQEKDREAISFIREGLLHPVSLRIDFNFSEEQVKDNNFTNKLNIWIASAMRDVSQNLIEEAAKPFEALAVTKHKPISEQQQIQRHIQDVRDLITTIASTSLPQPEVMGAEAASGGRSKDVTKRLQDKHDELLNLLRENPAVGTVAIQGCWEALHSQALPGFVKAFLENDQGKAILKQWDILSSISGNEEAYEVIIHKDLQNLPIGKLLEVVDSICGLIIKLPHHQSQLIKKLQDIRQQLTLHLQNPETMEQAREVLKACRGIIEIELPGSDQIIKKEIMQWRAMLASDAFAKVSEFGNALKALHGKRTPPSIAFASMRKENEAFKNEISLREQILKMADSPLNKQEDKITFLQLLKKYQSALSDYAEFCTSFAKDPQYVSELTVLNEINRLVIKELNVLEPKPTLPPKKSQKVLQTTLTATREKVTSTTVDVAASEAEVKIATSRAKPPISTKEQVAAFLNELGKRIDNIITPTDPPTYTEEEIDHNLIVIAETLSELLETNPKEAVPFIHNQLQNFEEMKIFENRSKLKEAQKIWKELEVKAASVGLEASYRDYKLQLTNLLSILGDKKTRRIDKATADQIKSMIGRCLGFLTVFPGRSIEQDGESISRLIRSKRFKMAEIDKKEIDKRLSEIRMEADKFVVKKTLAEMEAKRTALPKSPTMRTGSTPPRKPLPPRPESPRSPSPPSTSSTDSSSSTSSTESPPSPKTPEPDSPVSGSSTESPTSTDSRTPSPKTLQEMEEKVKDAGDSSKPLLNKEMFTVKPGDHHTSWEQLKSETATLYSSLDQDGNPQFPLLVDQKEVFNQTSNISCLKKGNIPEGSKSSPCLHANRVQIEGSKFKFVASQKPTLVGRYTFWDNVIGIPIIDLTGVRQASYQPYVPVGSEALSIKSDAHSITVKINTKTNLTSENASLITYDVEQEENGTKTQRQQRRFAYNDWPDHGVVTVDKLRPLVEDAKKLAGEKGELWIHCFAGIGRTGTLLTAILIDERIGQGTRPKNVSEVHEFLNKLILDIRKQRWNAVETPEQYKLLFDYTVELLCSPHP